MTSRTPRGAAELFERLLAESHLMEPGALPDDIHAACAVLGAERALVYLVDPRQRELVLLADPAAGRSRG